MPSPHDALFRATFEKPENAAAELRRVLPAELVATIDFTTLRTLPSHFVDDELDQCESDLLLAVDLTGGELLIYVLVEHQSSVDALMPFRLLRYLSRAWERYLKEHPGVHRVPPIVPVVLHHSASGWTAPTSLGALLDVPADVFTQIEPYVPDFRFLLHDLALEDLDALRVAALPPELKFALFLLQRTRNNADLSRELGLWTTIAAQLADDALRLVMSYILNVTDAASGPIRDWANRVSLQAEEAYVTAAEKIAQEARAKALVEGRVEGRREVLSKLLVRRFGELPESVQRCLRDASVEQLDDWALRMIDAATLEDVFIP